MRPVVGLWAHRLGDLRRRTGVGRYALELGGALATLATTETDGPAYELRGGREGDPLPDELHALPVHRSWPPRQALHLLWLATPHPLLEHVARPVDLLHVLFPSFPVPTRLPSVVTIHDLFVLDHPEWFEAAERRGLLASLHRAADEAARIVCVSQTVAADVRSRLGVDDERIAVVPNGISGAWIGDQPGPTGDRPYVVAVGSVSPRKNLEALLPVLARVPAVDLVVAGPAAAGPRDALLAAADRAGVGDRVRVLGWVDDAELGLLVRGAVALVHPAVEEGFGLPPLEAMAAGTPAVVADGPALRETAGAGAIVASTDDPDRWAAAVAELLDPAARATAAARGRAATSGQTWAAAARATAAVHRAVLEGTAGSTVTPSG